MLFVLLVVMSLLSRSARRRRRAAEEREYAEMEARRQSGDLPGTGGMSPVGMFGGLLEAMMGSTGGRSFTWDEATGQWVEITDEAPSRVEDAERSEEEPRAQRRRRQSSSRAGSSSSPFGGLMGSLGGMG